MHGTLHRDTVDFLERPGIDDVNSGERRLALKVDENCSSVSGGREHGRVTADRNPPCYHSGASIYYEDEILVLVADVNPRCIGRKREAKSAFHIAYVPHNFVAFGIDDIDSVAGPIDDVDVASRDSAGSRYDSEETTHHLPKAMGAPYVVTITFHFELVIK
jgi:hypothetical protein